MPAVKAEQNEALSRFQPVPTQNVRTASVSAPLAAHHGNIWNRTLNNTPNPAAAIAPQAV